MQSFDVKSAKKIFIMPFALGLCTLGSTFAVAASNNIPQVQHVIMIIQENRTPDNLFNRDTLLIQHGGHVRPTGNAGRCGATNAKVPLMPTGLFTCWGPEHNNRKPYPDWVNMWDNGKMDGACGVFVDAEAGCTATQCYQGNMKYCPYTFVQNSLWDGHHGILDPYFQVVNQYGWANFMFQTNQGGSFPAHQFLFSGTSAPTYYQDPNSTCTPDCWEWFDAENIVSPKGDTHKNARQVGCIGDEFNGKTAFAWELDPNSDESVVYTPLTPVNTLGFPCYNHQTMAELLEASGLTWKYYTTAPNNLWTAPNSFYNICQPSGYGGKCDGPDFKNNVVLPRNGDESPFLTDIANCNLPSVSWVIPDGNWSDHAGHGKGKNAHPADGGPSWIAAITNAIGLDKTCEGGKGYWSDTVIMVTWDDWGGYYDDVSPALAAGGPGIGYPNGTGGQYVYGFRVPLIVVSAYSKQTAQPPARYTGYVSPLNHDFGSMLQFIEYAFGQNGSILGGACGIGPCAYPYADYFFPEYRQGAAYGLSDFFDFTQKPLHFRTINGSKYQPNCFHTPTAQNCFGSNYPADPDDDANETSPD